MERREYKVDEIKVGPVKLKVLRLLSTSKTDEEKALEDMEVDSYRKGVYVEMISIGVDKKLGHAKKEIMAYGRGLGKKEISKWPKRLIAVGIARENKNVITQKDIEWYNVNDEVYVFEGDYSVEGEWALLVLALEDGMVVLTPGNSETQKKSTPKDSKQAGEEIVKKDKGEKKGKKRKRKSQRVRRKKA